MKAIRGGRLAGSVERRGRTFSIDPTLADEEWAASTSPAQERAKSSAGADPVPAPAPRRLEETVDEQRERAEFELQNARSADYRGALTIEKRAKAELAWIEVKKKLGRLVDVDVVRKQNYEEARGIGKRVMAIRDRLSGELAAESDPHRIRAILDAEFRAALDPKSKPNGVHPKAPKP